MRFDLTSYLPVGIVAVLLSCESGTDSSQHQEPGISFRLDPPAGAALGSFEPLAHIALDKLTPPVMSIRSAQLLPSGDILVADWRQQHIVVISSTGAVRRVFGREGAGPGEFRSLSQVLPLGPDSLLAYDNGLGRFSVFDKDGSFLASFVPTWLENGARVSHLLATPEGLLLGIKFHLSPSALLSGPQRDSIVLVLADRTGEFKGVGGLVVPDRLLSATVESNAIQVSVRPDGPRALVAPTNGGLLVAENTTHTVEVVPFSIIGSDRRVIVSRSPPSESKAMPVLGTMLPDGSDGAWITETQVDNHGQRRWFRVTRDGPTSDIVLMPEKFNLVAARGDTLLIREQDANGETILTIGIVRN